MAASGFIFGTEIGEGQLNKPPCIYEIHDIYYIHDICDIYDIYDIVCLLLFFLSERTSGVFSGHFLLCGVLNIAWWVRYLGRFSWNLRFVSLHVLGNNFGTAKPANCGPVLSDSDRKPLRGRAGSAVYFAAKRRQHSISLSIAW